VGKSSLVTDYEEKDEPFKSQIMIINEDGEEKLNPMQMIMLGMKDPKMLIQEVLRLPIKQLFWKGIRYRRLRQMIYICGFLLAV